MLQDAGRVTPVNRAIQFYISVTTACDSAFPFDPHDPFVVRVVDDAVVITPPTCDRETLDLPAITPRSARRSRHPPTTTNNP